MRVSFPAREMPAGPVFPKVDFFFMGGNRHSDLPPLNVTQVGLKHVRFMSESQGSLTVSRNTVSVTCHSSQLDRSSPQSPCVLTHAGIICNINITDITDGAADDT